METQEWNPGRLLETSSSYWKGCTLHAGVRLDVFTALGEKQLSAEDAASRVNTDARALSMLLNALTAMGLLVKKGEKYSNTEASATLLSKDSPRYMGYILMHHRQLIDSWSRLDEAVRTGKPVRTRASRADENARESFLS
jgi:DNA-binding transcriptional ArsR family regulator